MTWFVISVHAVTAHCDQPYHCLLPFHPGTFSFFSSYQLHLMHFYQHLSHSHHLLMHAVSWTSALMGFFYILYITEFQVNIVVSD